MARRLRLAQKEPLWAELPAPGRGPEGLGSAPLLSFDRGYLPHSFLFRALLGIGMGAEWPAGAALAMEQWPQRSRLDAASTISRSGTCLRSSRI
jgi:MFS family permease